MLDTFNRSITYLRVSITDRCNLRCAYCMPVAGVQKLGRADILSFEEIIRLVRIGADLGINKIRLTGGEPLIRKGVVSLIRALSAVPGITECALTTNGMLLPQFAPKLAGAGLHRVNISLDSLLAGKFRSITRGGELSQALSGIQTARKWKLTPIKVNTVIIRGVNDNEIMDFVHLAQEEDLQVRFIEFMPFPDNAGFWSRDKVVPAREVLETIQQKLPLLPEEAGCGAGPAEIYRFKSGRGGLGFISPLSRKFCRRCNRLRLTADGRLLNCLYADREYDVKTPLRRGDSQQALAGLFAQAVEQKHAGHCIQADGYSMGAGRGISRIGG